MGSGRSEQLDYLRGRHRITRDPRTGQQIEVIDPDQNYLSPPMFASGMPAVFSASNTPQNANVEFGSSREFSLYAYLSGIDEETTASPFTVLPTVVGTTPVGAVVCVGRLVYGDEGVSRTQYVNLSPGMAIKLPLIGSSARFGPILAPKYYNADDSDPTKRVYRVGVGGPILTSDVFSNPEQGHLQAVLGPIVAQQPALSRSATCYSNLSRGSQYSGDTNPKAARKFFGTLAIGGAGAVSTLCPVPYGSTQVRVIGSNNLQFNQLSRTTVPGVFTGAMGPFDANVQAQIMDNVDTIQVLSSAAVAGQEQAFELHFYPGL
jgi:hypothetical protein